MKASIRDLVRRERWATNASEHQKELDAELAAQCLAPETPFGWKVVIEDYFAKANERAEQLRKMFFEP